MKARRLKTTFASFQSTGLVALDTFSVSSLMIVPIIIDYKLASSLTRYVLKCHTVFDFGQSHLDL